MLDNLGNVFAAGWPVSPSMWVRSDFDRSRRALQITSTPAIHNNSDCMCHGGNITTARYRKHMLRFFLTPLVCEEVTLPQEIVCALCGAERVAGGTDDRPKSA